VCARKLDNVLSEQLESFQHFAAGPNSFPEICLLAFEPAGRSSRSAEFSVKANCVSRHEEAIEVNADRRAAKVLPIIRRC
jgi:hypothetical protein